MKAYHYPLAALALVLAGCGGNDDDTSGADNPPSATAEQACAALNGLQIPGSSFDSIAPTSGGTVQSTSYVKADDAGNANGEYCAVKGIIKPIDTTAPNIQFEVNLPTTWNNRALQMGGGAFDGSLVTGLGAYTLQQAGQDSPLKQGFVTLGSDGGHESSAGFDASFALNAEALANFGQLSVKKTHDAAMAVIKARYGAAPERFYFIGGSQGGHEALDAAARYYADYDGVIANYPAYNVTMLHLGSLAAGKAMYGNGGANWMDAAHVKLLTDAVYAACDPLDGASDGIIANVPACRTTFDITTLRCPGGATGPSCLSDDQIAGVRKIASPYRPGVTIAGMTRFEHWPILEGALFNVSSFGATPQPSNPPAATDALLYSVGTATTQYIITRDVNFDAMTLVPTDYADRIKEVGKIMDVSDVSLDNFFAKGGKLILTHGTADDFITPYNTIVYYNKLVASETTQTMADHVRFYLIPGMGHGFGPFVGTYDGLGVLAGWVENGVAPGQLTATDGNPGANRTRPLCQYPAYPKFTGAVGASLDDAANFTCTDPGAGPV